MSLISSPQNERVKLVRLLQHQAKARRQHGRLVLEGVRLVRDVLGCGVRPDFVLYVPDSAPDSPVHHLVQRLQDEQLTCHPVTEALMRAMSDTETPQGVLGVFPWPDLPLPDPVGLAVIADGWRDPGNLGTLIRTAAAAGVDLVATTPGTVDPFNPKTIRAGMGAQYRVAIRTGTWPDLAARLSGMAFYLADAAGESSFTAVDWTRPSVIVVGGEAHGFAQAAQDVPHTQVRIPMVAGAESLNAAVAASILIYEAQQQRTG